MTDPRIQATPPQSPPTPWFASEADEDRAELERALRWQAEHAEDGLWTVAELREMERAA
jgi:hypothetical protein